MAVLPTGQSRIALFERARPIEQRPLTCPACGYENPAPAMLVISPSPAGLGAAHTTATRPVCCRGCERLLLRITGLLPLGDD